MENCWEHLGIEPTADTAVIKKAYAKQLKFNKPDKNPEGFRDLRAAYEQALNESYWYEEDEDDDNFVESDGDDFELSEQTAFDGSATAAHIMLTHHSATNIKQALNAELIEDVDDQGEIENTNYGDGNLSTSDIYAIVEAIKQESREVLSDLKQSAIDEDSLEDTNLAEQPLEEYSLDDENFIPYNYYSSQWSNEWQQICDDKESDTASQDHHLHALLQTQLDAPRSLDEQNDYEEALLIWLANQEPDFPLSYHLAKTHFRWDRHLDHWSHNEYPWYMIEALNHNYQYVNYFQSPYTFSEYLTQSFSVIASYLSLDTLSEFIYKESKPTKLKRLDVFFRLFFPFKVTDLAKELKALNAELDYYIHEHPTVSQLALTDTDVNSDTLSARYWQQDSALNTLHGWVFNRFIHLKDFFSIVIIIIAPVGILSRFSEQPRQSFYYDGLGVVIILMLYYLFWQLQLRLFATPNRFVSHEPWSSGWRNASMLLFILGYISWLDVPIFNLLAAPTSPVYFLTHLAGFSLFAANSTRQHDVIVTATTWHASLMLLMLAVLVPLFIIVVAPPSHIHSRTFVISPLFWLLLAAPAFFISISDNYPKLKWLNNIGYMVLKLWHSLMLIGSCILLIYCADIFLKLNFGFTTVIILFITVIMALNMAVILGAFEED